jgi:phosphoglycolate phosphatase-like HAD superfamily hydrolase
MTDSARSGRTTDISVIFDIDGTLVQSVELDDTLFIQVLTEILGKITIHRDWNHYRHVTDQGIVAQILAEHRIADTSTVLNAVKNRFTHLLKTNLATTPCPPVPGATKMLRELQATPALRIGLATGAWRQPALAKLAGAGISIENLVLCSSDDHHARTEIMKRSLARCGGNHERALYVGDGLWDKKAAKELGWGFIAVGPRLKGRHPYWINDFLDPSWPDIIYRVIR